MNKHNDSEAGEEVSQVELWVSGREDVSYETERKKECWVGSSSKEGRKPKDLEWRIIHCN